VGVAAQTVNLAVTRVPAAGTPWATLVIAGAMGVRQDFYGPLARYFAANGIHALTFDYRGMGYSRRGSLRKVDVDLSGWAERDLNGMLFEGSRWRRSCRCSTSDTAWAGSFSGCFPTPDG
jgi:predicted alpha/beta hydrolase